MNLVICDSNVCHHICSLVYKYEACLESKDISHVGR